MDIRTEIVDYARPCMEAETALKQLHLAMLEKDYKAAAEHALRAIVETRTTLAAIRHEEEMRHENTKAVQSTVR